MLKNDVSKGMRDFDFELFFGANSFKARDASLLRIERVNIAKIDLAARPPPTSSPRAWPLADQKDREIGWRAIAFQLLGLRFAWFISVGNFNMIRHRSTSFEGS